MTAIPAQIGPAAPPRRWRFSAALIAGTTILLLAFPLVMTAAVVPKFEEIFRDFGVALPELTRWFIQISRGLSSPLGWAFTIAAILLVVVPLAAVASTRPRWAGVLLALASLGSLLYLLALVLSMFQPLVTMIESLQQSGKP